MMHLQRRVKKWCGLAQFRNLRISSWSFWDLRRRLEAASGVKSAEMCWSW